MALAIGAQVLHPYAHPCSPKKFTQPQLFACLVVKAFFKTDYRGIAQMLEDLPDLVRTLKLRHVPHYTTFQKALRRLLKLPIAQRLLTATVQRFLGRRRKVPSRPVNRILQAVVGCSRITSPGGRGHGTATHAIEPWQRALLAASAAAVAAKRVDHPRFLRCARGQ
jgi:hypothetical protein